MDSDLDRATANRGRPLGLTAAAIGGLFATLLLAAATLAHPVASEGPAVERAADLRLALERMTELAQRELRPPADRLARELPGEASRLSRLRDPASTVETQVSVALDELQRMNALTYDPHYLPALLAVGRAFTAASGQDPVTRTTVTPEYVGLERELAADAARLAGAASDAGKVSRGVKRITRELVQSKRRARRLERTVERMRDRNARGQGS